MRNILDIYKYLREELTRTAVRYSTIEEMITIVNYAIFNASYIFSIRKRKI